MSKPTIGQSHTVIQTLSTNTNWDVLDHRMLQKIVDNPTEAGKQFTAFLKNGGKVIVGEPRVIQIDRSIPFDPEAFIGDGWTIKEQDERALALDQIDLNEVLFETALEKKEAFIKIENKLKRLKTMDCIRLDAGILKTLWENQYLIPSKWKDKTDGKDTYIFFDGTVLKDPKGEPCILYLEWENSRWAWSYHWFEFKLDVSDLSAVLATNSTVVSKTPAS